jgi:hypothetical protein
MGRSDSILKSKFLLLLFLLSSMLLFLGCSNIKDSLSKEKANQLVVERHTNFNGKPSILSIEIKNNAYYVKWENRGNKESGTDKVTKDGEIEMVEAKIE